MKDSSTTNPPATPPAIQVSTAMSVGKASLMLAGMIALSRVLGLGRTMLTSYLYGTGPQAAAFEAAFNIPDTVTTLIAGGALATGFVPVFAQYLALGQQEQAQRTFRAMWTLLGCAFGVITLALFAATWTPLNTILAPSKLPPQYFPLYLYLLRILLAAQFFFVLGGLFTGTLNALRLFVFPALQPVVFNLGIMVFGIVLPKIFNMGIESMAWGALFGAVVGSLLIQAPAVKRSGLSLRPLWDLSDPGVKRVLASLLPIVLGLASGQVIALNLARFFANGLPPSELPAIGYANRLMQVPLDLLASGPAIALFPTLVALSAVQNLGEMRAQLAGTLRRILLLTLLATALLAALRFPIIQLLLQRGQFDKTATAQTAPVLFAYAMCIVGLGAQQLLARGFYALGDTRPPIYAGIVAVCTFGLLGWVSLQVTTSAAGLALAAAISISILSVLMAFWLSKKLGGWDEGATARVLCKGAAAALPTYFVALFAQRWLSGALSTFDTPQTLSLVKIAARAAVVVGGASMGILTFILIAGVLGVREMGPLSRISQKLFGRAAAK